VGRATWDTSAGPVSRDAFAGERLVGERLVRRRPAGRIGLLSDIHGNLSGLQAVVAALAAEDALDEVVVAGDHLQGGPRPMEVWSLLAELGWTLLRGNEDEALTTDADVEVAGDYREAYLAQLAW
jgi:hypothetical protein